MRTLRDMVFGAFIAAMVGWAAAYTVGTPPNYAGFQTVDAAWLNALAQGNNETYQSGVSAVGTNAATATALNSTVYLYEIDTVGSSTGVALPYAVPADILVIRNNGANPLTVYANAGTNPQTNATDTVNGGSSVSVNQNKSTYCFAAKNGVWSCLLSS